MQRTDTAQQPAQRLIPRHHGGSCVTGQQQPWRDFDLDRGFPEAAILDGSIVWFEAGGPLDAPAYLPRGGAELFQHDDGEPIVYFHEAREVL